MSFYSILGRVGLSIAIAGTCTLVAAGQTAGQAGQSTMGNMSEKNPSGLDSADKTFVRKAAQGGMAEVELGKLAAERAASPQVKKFGERMVADHTKANQELKEMAGRKNIPLPESVDAKDEATKQKLASLSGEEFDRAYMSDMVKDHTQDVSEFKHETTSAKDPEVKQFATKTLPTLEQHLKVAKQIEPEVAKGKQQKSENEMK